jgi:hypothetical protein
VGLAHGFIRAGDREINAHPAQVASVQTLVRRLNRERPPFDLIEGPSIAELTRHTYVQKEGPCTMSRN